MLCLTQLGKIHFFFLFAIRVCTLITSQTITWLKTKQGGPLVSHLSSGVKWPPNALEAQTAPYSIIFTELTTQPPPDPQIHHSTAKHEPMNRREKVLESEIWEKSQELKGKPQTWFAGGCRARRSIYDPTMSCWNSIGGAGGEWRGSPDRHMRFWLPPQHLLAVCTSLCPYCTLLLVVSEGPEHIDEKFTEGGSICTGVEK